MKIKITSKFGFQTYPIVDGMIDISEEELNNIRNKTKCFDVENNCVIDYDNSQNLKNEFLIKLRDKRDYECFSIINRGKLWYDNLTQEQLEELNKWYNDWLNVTDTLVEPEKPEWIK